MELFASIYFTTYVTLTWNQKNKQYMIYREVSSCCLLPPSGNALPLFAKNIQYVKPISSARTHVEMQQKAVMSICASRGISKVFYAKRYLFRSQRCPRHGTRSSEQTPWLRPVQRKSQTWRGVALWTIGISGIRNLFAHEYESADKDLGSTDKFGTTILTHLFRPLFVSKSST